MKKLINLKALIKIVGLTAFTLFCAAVLFVSVRGNYGNPQPGELIEREWRDDGPFELSPERGRFGLLYSMIEDRSFYFSTDIARFVVPDLGYKDGKYVSLFAPATSFLAMPGFWIGKYFGTSQVGSFLTISLFALINLFLVYAISRKLGAGVYAALLGGLIFLFATPAYAYGVNLYQHHISTFLILLASLIVISTNKVWPMFLVWFLCAASISVDYPNLFLMMPIGIYGLGKMFQIVKDKKLIVYRFKLWGILTFLGLVIPVLFFLWFNNKSYGNPLQFSGTVASVRAIDANGMPTSPNKTVPETVDEFLNEGNQNKSATLFFESRNLLNGLYLHFVSRDRGILYFTPIILIGLIGLVIANKQQNKYLPMFFGILAVNVVLYSLWGDPWGGWAFGSRYLIPAYAIMSAFVALALSKANKKWLIILISYPLIIYSVSVNTLGAITTSAVPPQVEALSLESISGKQERFSYDRNLEYLNAGRSKSFVYKTWLSGKISSINFYYILTGSIILVSTILIILSLLNKDSKKK